MCSAIRIRSCLIRCLRLRRSAGFRRALMDAEEETGVLREQFERQRERFAEQCPDYGRDIGFDGLCSMLHRPSYVAL